MTETPRWQETESRLRFPGLWLPFLVGSVFLAIGVGGLLGADDLARGDSIWILRVGAGIFALFGAIALTYAAGRVIFPVYVRHAAPGTLPGVPSEPILYEGLVAHGLLTHELAQTPQGWQYRPQQRLWRNDKRFLLGFGIPYLTIFSGLASWIIHQQMNGLGWPVSIVCGILITLLSGGVCLLLMGMITRASYHRLCWLNVPRNGGDLELDAPKEVDLQQTDLAAAFQWVFLGETNRYRLTIPRESIKAVQLCPWKYSVGKSGGDTTWSVQGLLVLQSSEEDAYYRFPLLLTSSDFAGAAELMQRLAMTLDIPYLFHADAAGWRAEEMAARQRQPIQVGGIT